MRFALAKLTSNASINLFKAGEQLTGKIQMSSEEQTFEGRQFNNYTKS